jgi:hypothetical protein
MSDATASDQVRTALVVLSDPSDPSTSPGGAETAERAETVRNWFAARGFDVDPVVGISFAISAPERVFTSTFGTTEPDRSTLVDRFDAGLLPYVNAVVVGPPPDFGPGNP